MRVLLVHCMSHCKLNSQHALCTVLKQELCPLTNIFLLCINFIILITYENKFNFNALLHHACYALCTYISSVGRVAIYSSNTWLILPLTTLLSLVCRVLESSFRIHYQISYCTWPRNWTTGTESIAHSQDPTGTHTHTH